jgi:hypothetical protein
MIMERSVLLDKEGSRHRKALPDGNKARHGNPTIFLWRCQKLGGIFVPGALCRSKKS